MIMRLDLDFRTAICLIPSMEAIILNITELKIMVGLNILIAETINIAGTENRPLLKLQTTGDAERFGQQTISMTQMTLITMTFTF